MGDLSPTSGSKRYEEAGEMTALINSWFGLEVEMMGWDSIDFLNTAAASLAAAGELMKDLDRPTLTSHQSGGNPL